MAEKDLLSVVIPCYKSEKTIAGVIEKEMRVFEENGIGRYEFILVNDCSPDRTWDTLKELGDKYPFVKCINLSKNVGQHGAIMAGFNHVSGDLVVLSDDDGQTQMEAIGQMMACLETGYDVVMADTSFTHEKRSIIRKLGTKLNDAVSNVLLDNPKKTVLSIFFLARRFVIDEVVRYKNPYPYVTGLILRATHNIGVVKVEHLSRLQGTSGYTFKKLFSLWTNGMTAFSIVPLRIAAYIGFISALIGMLYGLYLVIRKLIMPASITAGWSSTVAIVLLMSGIILCVLGVIGEYLGRIYMCINNAPQYIIRDTVNLDDRGTHG